MFNLKQVYLQKFILKVVNGLNVLDSTIVVYFAKQRAWLP